MNKFMKIIVVFTFSLMFAMGANAKEWPAKGIKLTIGYGAGGTADLTARVLAALLEKELDTKITVINKPGGGGAVAAALAKIERPDGYSLFTLTTGAGVILPHIQELTYDPLKDFTFISQYAQWSLGIVASKDAPYNTLEELVDYSKKHPGEISYSIAGAGTPQHLIMLQIAQEKGVDWKAIPFKGGAAAVTALLGGHVSVMAGATEWLSQVKAGTFKLITILTDTRMDEFPNIPTLAEVGYKFPASTFLGIAGPKGIPDDVVKKLQKAIHKVSQDPEMKKIITKLAMQTKFRDSKDFELYFNELYNAYGNVVKTSNLGK